MGYIVIIFIIAIIIFQFRNKKYSFQKEFKKCESPIEEMLVRKLYEEGLKPYTQVPCGKYRIDIGIYHKGKKMAIECDGEAFHTSPEQKKHDAKKDLFLQKNRWKVLRFTGKEIYHQPDWCVEVIKKN